MVAFQYKAAVICVLLIIGSVTAAKKDKNKNRDNVTDDGNRNSTEADSTTSMPKPSTTTLAPLVKCKDAHCSHQCIFVKVIGAVCTCPDERMYLNSAKVTCKRKVCANKDTAKVYSCGKGATCSLKWDFKERQSLAQCTCPNSIFSSNARYLLNKETRSCEKDQRYQTCDWPVTHSCSQTCKVVSKTRGIGTEAQCVCRPGYSLDASGKNCVVTNPCLADGLNGGCQHKCSFNSKTLAVQCSCHGDGYTLNSNGRTCDVKSCKNKNSGCEQDCIQTDNNNYYCSCKLGFHLDSNEKTCTDYDECGGFHGCDQKCIPDGNHYYTCACNSGYYLADNGFSCRVNLKCANHGCSQHCNPTTGACFCDSTQTLGQDGKTCVDVDECLTNKHNCAETCTNTNGGFSCGCNDPKARLSNDLKTCILDTCGEIDDILYGTTTCKHGHSDISTMKVGDYCTFTCSSGFRLSGSPSVYCTKTGYDVTPPHCSDIDECKEPLRCGANEVCSNKAGGFNCFCQPGYNKENGKCVDRKGPQILTCPSDATLQLPDDSDSIKFTWKAPTTFDPTDSKLTCSGCPQGEEKVLKLGDENFRYLYSDRAGNRALCQFKVKVVDVTSPVFTGCPNGTVFKKGPGLYSIDEFATVTVNDNSGAVSVTTDKPDEFSKPGVRTVNYVATDGSGNHDSCTFYINITVTDCPELKAPKNGFHGCGDWHAGTYCQPSCMEDYAFNQPKIGRYHCGSDGVWEPSQQLPDCYPTVQPVEANIKYFAKYKLEGTCPTEDADIKKRLIQMARGYFDQSTSVFCFIDDSCTLAVDPEITCDKDEFTLTLITSEDYSKVPEHDSMLIEFKRKIRAQVAKQSAFMNLFIPPITVLPPLVDQNALPLTPLFTLSCPSGSRRVENTCVTCDKGDSC